DLLAGENEDDRLLFPDEILDQRLIALELLAHSRCARIGRAGERRPALVVRLETRQEGRERRLPRSEGADQATGISPRIRSVFPLPGDTSREPSSLVADFAIAHEKPLAGGCAGT